MSDLRARARTGEEATLKADAIQGFRKRLRGELIRPDDAGYDEARKVYNAMHDRRPSLIVRAAGVADVITTVTFAADAPEELGAVFALTTMVPASSDSSGSRPGTIRATCST